MASIDFLAQAEALRDELIARRRDFHMHPELAFEEVRTASIVAEELNRLGLEVQTGVGKTGVVAILEGNHDGPTILVRADMDALPVQEQNTTEYISTYTGKMHACGHDGHTAIALGVAKLLTLHRDNIRGRVKFVFQPAEEVGGGARAMIADGALSDPRPDVSLGLHLWNSVPVGMFGVASGPVMAGASVFEIEISGSGGHGAMPHETIDPIICASQMTLAFQTIASRNVNPLDTVVVSVTQIHAGTTNNVIPSTAFVSGTFRAFRTEVRDMVTQRLQEIAEHTALALGCTVDVKIHHYTTPVTNNVDVSEKVRQSFLKMGITSEQFCDERTMAAEDVGEFMTDIPGMYFFVGSANKERDLHYAHHHPRFDFDEDALPLGVALLSAAVADYVIEG